MTRKRSFYFLLFVLTTGFAWEQSTAQMKQVESNLLPATQPENRPLERFNLLDRMKFYGVTAVSIAVVDQGKLQWAKAYGYADEGLKRKATPSTLFHAASITKSFNSVLLFRLAEKGKLSLEADVRPGLRTWKLPENQFSEGQKVTLLHLLSHSSGINNAGIGTLFENDSIPTIDQVLTSTRPAKNKKIEFISRPGEQYFYSNTGHLIIQKYLQDNVASDYPQLMKDLVLAPLGLRHSNLFSRLPQAFRNKAATGYVNGEIYGKYPITPAMGSGSLWTTPSDLARFIIAVQHMYQGKLTPFMSRSAAQKMLKPFLSDTVYYQLSYGRAQLAPGFFRRTVGGQPYFFHTGGLDGYSSIYYGGLENGKGAVIMVNSNNTQILFEILNSIAETYKWTGFYAPAKRPTVAVADSLLNSYAGEYEFKDLQLTFRVVLRNRQLYVQSSSGTDPYSDLEKLFAYTPEKFFLLSNALEFKFAADKVGNPISILYVKSGNDVLKGTKK